MGSLFIKLLQMTGYVKRFEGNTKMYFKIHNEKLLKLSPKTFGKM